MTSTGKTGRVSQFHRTKTAGVYVRHKNDCNAAFGEGRCGCEPSYRGNRRSPTTGKPEWSKTSKDRSEILTWLGAGEKAKPAVAERAEEGRTFKALADEWIDGVTTGRIQRRRANAVRDARGVVPKSAAFAEGRKRAVGGGGDAASVGWPRAHAE